MSDQHVRYLLIGAGLASASAAAAIRQRDAEGSMALIGQEIYQPYHRPPLSKNYLRRQMPREELFTQPPGWFESHQIELHTGRSASRLDTSRSSVMLDNGREITYDRLLLATGASARPLQGRGSDLPNIFTLRTIEDEQRLHHALHKARMEGRKHETGRGRVGIIGAGLLGVELAGSLRQMGLAVDLVARGHPWDKFAGPETSRFIGDYLQGMGVTLHLAAQTRQVAGDGRVQRIELTDGSIIDCDILVACVGATSNKDLLRGTPIAAENAILVDDHCRTSVSDIFAAGDCAAIFDPLFGKHRVIDHWDNAQTSGALAGRNMAGADEAYAAVNHFFSDIGELTLDVWGEARLIDRRLLRTTTSANGMRLVELGVAADGRICQALTLHSAATTAAELAPYRELVGRRAQVRGREEAIKDPAFAIDDL